MESKNLEYVIVADCAMDVIFLPNDEQYGEIFQTFLNLERTIEDPIKGEKAKVKALTRLGQELKISAKRVFGGPVFNIAQYLRAREQIVSAMSVVGNNNESRAYKAGLRKMGVNTAGIFERKGKMPKCYYVYQSPEVQMQPIWVGEVSERGHSPRSDFYLPLLNSHDVMIFSVTNPRVAMKAIDGFRKTLAYNPGPIFDYTSFQETKFLEIMEKVTILSSNAREARQIREGLNLGKITDLFERYRNLDYIIKTKGEEGSELYLRSGEGYECKRKGSIPSEEIVDDIGAGDAFFATAVYGIMQEMAPYDVLLTASIAAEQSLRFRGATDPSLLKSKEETTPYRGIRKVNGE